MSDAQDPTFYRYDVYIVHGDGEALLATKLREDLGLASLTVHPIGDFNELALLESRIIVALQNPAEDPAEAVCRTLDAAFIPNNRRPSILVYVREDHMAIVPLVDEPVYLTYGRGVVQLVEAIRSALSNKPIVLPNPADGDGDTAEPVDPVLWLREIAREEDLDRSQASEVIQDSDPTQPYLEKDQLDELILGMGEYDEVEEESSDDTLGSVEDEADPDILSGDNESDGTDEEPSTAPDSVGFTDMFSDTPLSTESGESPHSSTDSLEAFDEEFLYADEMGTSSEDPRKKEKHPDEIGEEDTPRGITDILLDEDEDYEEDVFLEETVFDFEDIEPEESEPEPELPPAPAPVQPPQQAPAPRPAPPPTTFRAEEQFGREVGSDSVQFASYYPREIAPLDWKPFLVYVYRERATIEVADDAAGTLQDLLDDFRRAVQVSSAEVKEGAMISVKPELADFQFNPPQAQVGFYEDWHRVSFKIRSTVNAPLNRAVNGNVTFAVEGVIVADMPISIFVTEQPIEINIPPKTIVKPYQAIFCSYSRDDTVIVERVERAYRALGMEFLRDVVALKSGQDWDDTLLEFIESADIFQLFWSSTAAESPYVKFEYEHAASLNRGAGYIRPVYWEQPLAPVPDILSEYHFAYEPTLDD